MSDDNDFTDIAEDLIDAVSGLPTWVFVTAGILLIGILALCIL